MIQVFPFLRGWPLIMAALLVLAATPARAEDDALETRRAQFRSALEVAQRGTEADFRRQRAALADHPLAVWLDYAHLQRRIDRAADGEIEAFIARYADQPAAGLLRERWLGVLLQRQDWASFEKHYSASTRLTMRCAHALARLRTGNLDEDWFADVQALWRNGQSLPNDCDLPFAELHARGRLPDALRWERIELAAQAGQPGLMRFLARALPASDQQLAERYAAFVVAPTPDLSAWPKDARSGRIATVGLTALAKRDPDAAETLLAQIAQSLALPDAQLGPIRYQIALWSAASYLPDSARRLAAVPAAFYDERLHRWRLREALARGDDSAALAAIGAVDPAAREDGSRWRYFEARLRERAGQTDRARDLYAAAARHADFHGFMAADRLGLPYALCPLRPSAAPELRARM
ncbi:MAG: lytic murein transglycosylase, partial [Gammaproteobacteria bacterium HGW-Gammaproteobacteria-7]